MLYNSIMHDIAINPNDKKITSIIEQYEEQRNLFLNKRIGEVQDTYSNYTRREEYFARFF